MIPKHLMEAKLCNEDNCKYKRIIDELTQYVMHVRPLSINETGFKEYLKTQHRHDKEVFKTICHLEDFEIAIQGMIDILRGEDKNVK